MNLSLSSYIALYFGLSKSWKKIIQYLFFVRKKKGVAIFSKQSKILQYAGCSSTWLKKLHKKNREEGNLMFEVAERFDLNGRQTTNLYTFSGGMFEALLWLENNHFLNTPKKRWAGIISSIGNAKKVTPPPVKKLPPLVKIKIRKEIEIGSTPPNPLKKEYIHPKIDMIRIPKEDKIKLSRYPEAWIEWGLETTLMALNDNCKINNPTAFLWYNIRKAQQRIVR